MRDKRVIVGVVLGLAIAAAFVTAGGRLPSLTLAGDESHGTLSSDAGGPMEEIVIHYVPASAPIVERVYRDLLAALPASVTVWAVCPDPAAFADLCARVGASSGSGNGSGGSGECRLRPVIVGHAITTWSRDRWLALSQRRGASSLTTLLAPQREAADLAWPERAGDAEVAADLVRQVPLVEMLRSRFEFDGGDFVADTETVFVTPRVVARNVPHRASEAELAAELSRLFGRRVVLLTEAPEHHAGMFIALAGDRTALVGDPSLGRALAPPASDIPYDFSPELQGQFDAVAAQVRSNGYRVVRMPILCSTDGRTYATPLNVLMEQRDGRRVVYMPFYRDHDALSGAATAVWRDVGFEVRPVDCTATYRFFGSLRCLVSVLRRGAPERGLRACSEIICAVCPPMHPARLRCSGSTYAEYALALAPCRAGASAVIFAQIIPSQALSVDRASSPGSPARRSS